jgi:hypothetical protein
LTYIKRATCAALIGSEPTLATVWAPLAPPGSTTVFGLSSGSGAGLAFVLELLVELDSLLAAEAAPEPVEPWELPQAERVMLERMRARAAAAVSLVEARRGTGSARASMLLCPLRLLLCPR